MAQQNIDYGSFPNDPQADAIRIAFEKVQNNFTELYGNLSNIAGNVSAVTAGTGIATNGSTGNVTVTSIFSSLTVHSNSMSITGLGGFVPTGGTAGQDYTVNNATNTLFVELNSNFSPTFTDLTVDGNLSVNGASITAQDANIELTNGNIRLTNGSFSGNIVSLVGPLTVQYADTSNIVTGDTNFVYDSANTTLTVVGGNIVTDTVRSQYLVETINLNVSNVANITNTATVGQLVSSGDISGLNGNLSGNLTVGGIIETVDVVATGNVSADLFSGSGLELTDINASNITSGTVDPSVMSGTYDISITGFAETSGTVTEAVQSNITEVGVLTNLSVAGTINTGNIISGGTVDADTGNFSGELTVNQLSSNGNVSGTNANFTENITGVNTDLSGLITADSVTVNTVVTGNSATFSGTVEVQDLTVTGNTTTGELTVTGNSQVANVSGANFNTANITSTGTVTAVEFVGNQADILGNVIAGNVFANTGKLSAQSAEFTGLLESVNGIFTGNINSGNILVSGITTTDELTVTTSIVSESIVNSGNIQSNIVTANTVNSTAVISNTVTASDTATTSVLQLTGLSSDPSSPQAGQLYYNTVTGKFRVYNGVLNQWQSLN